MEHNLKEWFAEWFDSIYYHILYKNRGEKEAEAFVNRLYNFFSFLPKHKILDLACGKGRHAIQLNQSGLDVVGVDLSQLSIGKAKEFENDRLKFFVHDMRDPLYGHYDFILNLFTSIGYFESHKENQQVIESATQSLKPGGTLIVDFLNIYQVKKTLVPYDQKLIEGITFDIYRKINNNNTIIKDIYLDDDGEKFHFQERVKAITYEDFMKYFKNAGLTVTHTFGDYKLNPFDIENSERLIIAGKK